MKINSAAIFSHYSVNSAIGSYRVFSPLREAVIEAHPSIKDGQVDFEAIEKSDLVLIQREFGKELNKYESVVKLARKLSKPIVYDTDTLLINPEPSPGHINLPLGEALLPTIRSISEADLVTVPTQTLKNALSSYNSNTVVLPNFLDTHYWQIRKPVLRDSEKSPVVLGYLGGENSKPNLEFIQPVISKLLSKFGDKLRFTVWGLQPPNELLQFPQTKWIRISTNLYDNFVSFFQRQEADIFLAPLADNILNRCASEVKFLEYSALGSPVVASNLEPYSTIIKNRENGFLATTFEEWEYYLTELLTDPILRYELALHAQETIEKNWLLSDNAYKWVEVYNEVHSIAGGKDNPIIIERPAFNSITQQVFELHKNQTEEINQLYGRLIEKDLVIQDRNHAIQKMNIKLSSKSVAAALTLQQFLDRLFPRGSAREKVIKHISRFFEKMGQLFSKHDNPASDINLIRKSPFFDATWYLSKYEDVSRSKIDPAAHFLKFGGFEARDPGPNFDSEYYLANYPDARKEKMNPLLHYIQFGASEGYKTCVNQADVQTPNNAEDIVPIVRNSGKVETTMNEKKNLKYFGNKSIRIIKDEGFREFLRRGKQKVKRQIIHENPLDTDYDPNLFDASIIIPVYNASDYTKACIEKLYSSPNLANFEVIVVDNDSKDETKGLLAEEQKRRPNFSYYRMAENYGFAGGVNHGLSQAKGKYLIILNNDTLVTPGWIDRLIEAFRSDELIGLVSPVTNYVGEGPQVDPSAMNISPTEIDAYAQSIVDKGIIYESHRLVFFCVALKREVVDNLGLMDTGYIKGNFEDDDYCLRAILAGYRLAIAQNSFVYHFGSMTFKKNRIIHDDYMDKNRKRFYPKVQRLSLTIKPAKQLTNHVKISTVVRTKNRPSLLRKALISLSNQTYRDFEVVLINDGGEDVSDLVDSFSKYFPIKYISNEKSQGRTPALNTGVSESSGDWITFLDDDDIVYPWHLDMLFNATKLDDKHRFQYCNYNRSIFRTVNDEYSFLIESIAPWDFNQNELLVRNRMPIHTWLVHASAFNEVGWFDESMSMLEDFEFLIRLNKVTDFHHVDRVSCEYRYYLDGLNSMINQRSKTFEALESIYAKHPVKDLVVEENRMLELSALHRQINIIEKIEQEMTQESGSKELLQKQLLSQILGI